MPMEKSGYMYMYAPHIRSAFIAALGPVGQQNEKWKRTVGFHSALPKVSLIRGPNLGYGYGYGYCGTQTHCPGRFHPRAFFDRLRSQLRNRGMCS